MGVYLKSKQLLQFSLMLPEAKTYTILILILSLFFLAQFVNLNKHTQSFRFGDESEHLAPGWMMANYGSKLYEDISTNHQPLPIIYSYTFFKTVDYPNLFMLIERVRQSMLLVSFIGAFIIVLSFKWQGLITVLLVETGAFWLFGFHVLAESLTLYPTIFVMGAIARRVLWKNQWQNLLNSVEPVIFGLSVFVIAFSLLPSIPFLLLASIAYFYKSKTIERRNALLATLIPIILLFIFIGFSAWFRDTVIDNLRYFIPYDSAGNETKSYLLLFFYPFKSLLNHSVPVSKYYFLITILFVISIITILKKSKAFSLTLKLLFLYLMMILLNLRISKIDIGFYTAFHVLPQLGAFTILTVLLLKLSIEKLGNKTKQKILFIIICVILIFTNLYFNTAWWRENKDKNEEHFIQYGDLQSISSVFKILKKENDKLLVGELEGLLNIAADMPIAGSQNAYLNWSFQSADSRQKLTDLMTNNPPTFIYFPEGGNYLSLLKPFLESNYTRIQRYDGGVTNAYIKKSEINKRTKKQWKEFENLFYKIPEEALIN